MDDVFVPKELDGLQKQAYLDARFTSRAAAPWQDPSSVIAGQQSRWIYAQLHNGKDQELPHITAADHHVEREPALIGWEHHQKAWSKLFGSAAEREDKDPGLHKQLHALSEGEAAEIIDVVLHMAVRGKGKKPIVLEIYPLFLRERIQSEGVLYKDHEHRLLLRLHQDHFARAACGDIHMSNAQMHGKIPEDLMPQHKEVKAVKIEFSAGHGSLTITGPTDRPECADCRKGLYIVD